MKASIPTVIFCVALVFVCVFLLQRYNLGLVRYFDMDEFAYLNWVSHFVKGSMPYRDFLYQLPPGYLLFLTPFVLVSHTPFELLVHARIGAWMVFVALVITNGVLFYLLRRSWIAIFASLLLVFLPLPSDKLIEVRPDTIGVLLAMLGSVFQLLWMEHSSKKNVHLYMMLSGLFYGLSVFMLQKTIPHVAIATGVALLWWRQNKKISLVPYMISGGLLFVLFGVWALINGIGPTVWYFITQFPKETIPMARDFAIPPWFFFRFIDVYYGVGGWNWGYIGNQILWIAGICMGSIRLLSPFAVRGKQGWYGEFMLASIFITQVLLFIYVMPFKHSQYLIPLAVFVALYSADIIYELWMHVQHTRIGRSVMGVGLLLLFYGCYVGHTQVQTPKMYWTNESEKHMLAYMQAHIPQDAYVFDLVGVSLSYPQPYYVSCLPVGQFSQYVSIQLPSISEALEKTQTRYIYQGAAKRVTTLLPQDQEYIKEHFVPLGDGSLLVRK